MKSFGCKRAGNVSLRRRLGAWDVLGRMGCRTSEFLMLALFVWVAVAVVIALLMGFAKMLAGKYDWKLLLVIRRARREIRRVAQQRVPNAGTFSIQGATAINPSYVDFWITTATDKERDLLARDAEIYNQFCEALLKAGYPQDAASRVHFRIQSQETVDREYGGSWREAAEMP